MLNQRLGLIILFSTNCKTIITVNPPPPPPQTKHTHTHKPTPSVGTALSQSVAESHFTLRRRAVYSAIKISKQKKTQTKQKKVEEKRGLEVKEDGKCWKEKRAGRL